MVAAQSSRYGKHDILRMTEKDAATYEFLVRVTHFDKESAKNAITGNALDDPFSHVSVERFNGEVNMDE
jgi:hypothetical protein